MRSYFRVPMRSAYTHEEHNYKIIQYGLNNSYPQEVLYAWSRSSIAGACTKAYKDFIQGNGFEDSIYNKMIVNKDGDSIQKLLFKLSNDYSKFKGFAIRFDVNLLGEYVCAEWLPFWQVRLGMPNELGQIDHVKTWDNWAGESTRYNVSANDIKSLSLFNPDPSVIQKQIEDCGGIENYNGQVLYYVGESDFYPSCSFDNAFDDVISTGELSHFNKNFIKNKFSASSIIVNETVSSGDDEYLRNKREVGKMSGSDTAGSVVYLEGNIRSFNPSLPDLSKQHQVVSESLKDNIVECYNIPPVLVSRTRQGGFPNQDEITNSFDYYNGMTQHERDMFSDVFESFNQNWHFPLNTSGDFNIKPKTFNNGRNINI